MSNLNCRPYMSWAGSKGSVMPYICEAFPLYFKVYHEPFMGSGSVFFANRDRIAHAKLSDTNPELMITHQMVRDHPIIIMDRLEEFAHNHSKKFYDKVTLARTVDFSYIDEYEFTAVRMIYLSKTCYNGLYRVNRLGQFNNTMGTTTSVDTICNRNSIINASRALQNTTITYHDYSSIKPKKRYLVYLDPPYHLSKYTSYTASAFTEDAQTRLAEHCHKWRDKGVYILQSNSDTKLIRSLYKDYYIKKIPVKRIIAANSLDRQVKHELLISSYRKGGSLVRGRSITL